MTPALLSTQNWDDVAEAAKWSRTNADVLVDTHWIGGAPADGQAYGWASWAPRKGILTLRNPANHRTEIKIDPAKAFELPENAAKSYTLNSPFPDQVLPVTHLKAGEETVIKLKPFEVLVMEALPDATSDSH